MGAKLSSQESGSEGATTSHRQPGPSSLEQAREHLVNLMREASIDGGVAGPSSNSSPQSQRDQLASSSDTCLEHQGRTRRFASLSDAHPISIQRIGGRRNVGTNNSFAAGRTNSTSASSSGTNPLSSVRYFDSDSSPEEGPYFLNMFQRHGASSQSLPVHLMNINGLKCPICSKHITRDEIEVHLVMCLTKPRISYNEDNLTSDHGECVICFEEMICGETIARLPCLCIYHKVCIDEWFKRSRTCPEHPSDDYS